MGTERDESAAFGDEEERPRRRLLSWLPVAALAILAVEFTADPALGVVVVCLKIGGGDLLTAWWVRGRDPYQPRGRACSWFFAAIAFLKIGAAALFILLVTVMVVVIAEDRAKGPGPPPRAALGAILLLFSCYVLMAVTSWAAVVSAAWHNLQVWADTRAGQARKRGTWPPLPGPSWRPPTNGAGLVLLYATVSAPITVAIVVQVVVVLSIVLIPGPVGMALAGILIAVVLAAVVSVLRNLGRFRRVVAPTPWHCYWSPPASPG